MRRQILYFISLAQRGEMRTIYRLIGLECVHGVGDSWLIYTIQIYLHSTENKVLWVSTVC